MSEGLSGWNVYQLGQLIDRGSAELQTGPFGTMLNSSEYTVTGTPVIAVQDIGENKLSHHKFVYVNEFTVKRLSRYKVKKGDIIFGRKGAVERRAIIKTSEEGWLQGSDCIRLRFDDSIDAAFISYQFGSESHREWMLQFASGATMPSLNQQILKLLPIRLPALPEQKVIAAVLSSLDDKIDLLHRQNKTLESMAETLFRQWFIEEAQEDWADTTLDCHSEVLRGLSYKGSGLSDSGLGIPMHNLNSIYEGGGYKEVGIKYYTAEFKERHLVRNGEIIVANTEQGHEFKLIGCPAIVPSFYGEKGLFSQHIYRVILKENSYLTTVFLYCLLMTPNIREQIISATNGSTVNMLAIDGLQRPKFKLPPKEKVVEFSRLVKSWWKKKDVNHLQLRTLEKLRDTLLPKLMNGDVRIKN